MFRMTSGLVLATLILLPTIATAQDKPTPQPRMPLSDRVSLAVERQYERDAAKRGAENPVARRVKGATGMVLDGKFIGAIALNDLANAGVKHDRGAVDDLGYALTTPEFYAGIGIFNATYAGADKVVEGAASKLIPARVAAAEGGLLGAAKGGLGFLKHNLVLATALTLPRIFQADFGGFNLGDAGKHLVSGIGGVFHGHFDGFGKLGGDFKKLTHTRIHVKPHLDWQSIGITLGSFATAGVLWEGVKKIGGLALKSFAKKMLVAAPLEAGALAVPVGGEVFDAVVTAGLAAWTVVDLAGLLFTAGKIEDEAQHLNDQRRFENAAEDAKNKFIAVTKENGGHPDPKKLDAAMADLARSMADLRDFHYLDVAIADAKFTDRLKRAGVSQDKIDALGAKTLDETGAWLAAPGQTAALVGDVKPGTALTAGADQKKVAELAKDHADEVRKELEKLAKADKIDATRLDPANKDFAFSRNRDQLYDEEMAILARGATNLKDVDLAQRVLGDAEIVGGLAEADSAIVHAASDPKSVGLASVLGASGN